MDVDVQTLPGREGPTLWDKILTLFNRSHLTAALEKHWKENLVLFWKLRTPTPPPPYLGLILKKL